jgi:hypothetical protein
VHLQIEQKRTGKNAGEYRTQGTIGHNIRYNLIIHWVHMGLYYGHEMVQQQLQTAWVLAKTCSVKAQLLAQLQHKTDLSWCRWATKSWSHIE